MSYAVANGAVGKSPLIDRMNQVPVEQIAGKAAEQMEQQVFGAQTEKGVASTGSDTFFFDRCREEVKNQIEAFHKGAR